MEWFLKCIRNYANFKGRARRTEYWYFILFSFLLTVLAFLLDRYAPWKPDIVQTSLALFLFLPNLAVLVRRLHDTGRSGKMVLWFYLALFGWIIVSAVSMVLIRPEVHLEGPPAPAFSGLMSVLMLGILLLVLVWGVFFLVWCCTEGNKGENKYGPDPKAQ